MQRMKLSELILDETLYPRSQIIDHHVRDLKRAIEAGVELPAPTADFTSHRVSDGFHRITALREAHGDDYEIDVILKKYENDQELFLDAVRLNANHGVALSNYDRTKVMLKARELKIDVEQVASALSLTVTAVGKLTTNKLGELKVAKTEQGEDVPLKRPVSHLAGTVITEEQRSVMPRVGGNDQRFYIRQLLIFIDNGLLDTNDPQVTGSLRLLYTKLKEMFSKVAA